MYYKLRRVRELNKEVKRNKQRSEVGLPCQKLDVARYPKRMLDREEVKPGTTCFKQGRDV